MIWQTPKRLFSYDLQGFEAIELFASVAHLPYSIFLDSNRAGHPLSSHSYICWEPFETIESLDGRVTVTNKDNQFSYAADPFQVVRERLSLYAGDIKTRKDLPPFQGGAVGYFGYDLARGIENLPTKAETTSQPDMCIGLYDKIIAFDHSENKVVLMVRAEDETRALTIKNSLQKKSIPDFYSEKLSWQTTKDDTAYKKDIARIVEYIYAGDIFQANLSRRFMAELPKHFDSFAHYAYLRTVNPAPYAAYMNFGGVKLASCSPERFLEVRGKTVETRPIKGTLSSSFPSSQLKESEKDVAENIMIVDLLRNDLSKVCDDHSIEVKKLCDVETFEGLHHLVSIVRGKLRGNQGPLEALKACFPGGSITGAPKIRAMQIIEDLEPQSRGAYCGAIGYIGFDGTMDTAITIRTLVYEGNSVHLQTGGGITAKSDPQKELDETLTKAEKIFESFNVRQELRKKA